MQFKSIIVVLSLALAATSVPTGSTTTTGPVCQPSQTVSYCTSTNKNGSGGTGSGGPVGGLLGGLLGGIGPVTIIVSDLIKCIPVSVIPIASGNNQVANACCDTSGVQNGVVNVGTPCVVVPV